MRWPAPCARSSGHWCTRSTPATRALADIDGDHDRLYAEPEAWIQMVEVPDGGWGTRGQVTGFADVIAMIRARSAALAG